MERTSNFQPAVYFMANQKNGAIYTGLTSDLPRRAWQHREGLVEGFTKKYGCKRLVWFEFHATMEHGILREKQIKGGTRRAKIALIEAANPDWRDLFFDLNSSSMDCFVAALLAMTGAHRHPAIHAQSAKLIGPSSGAALRIL